MNVTEIANTWKRVVEIYNDTREQKPKETMSKIVSELGIQQTKEVFAVISAIKSSDGRIYGINREYMNCIPVESEVLDRSIWNPIFFAGLDDIHTGHIDQLITELRKLEKDTE